jgi:hypothetical protein
MAPQQKTLATLALLQPTQPAPGYLSGAMPGGCGLIFYPHSMQVSGSLILLLGGIHESNQGANIVIPTCRSEKHSNSPKKWS